MDTLICQGCLFDSNNRHTGPHARTVEPSLVHLQGVFGGASGRVGVLALGLHVIDIQDDSVVIHERDGEGQQGVLHPKGPGGIVGKDEQHPGVIIHLGPEHEPRGPCDRGRSQLGPDMPVPHLKIQKALIRSRVGSASSA